MTTKKIVKRSSAKSHAKKVSVKAPAKKAPAQTMKNVHITLIHKQGPYQNKAQAEQRKSFLKQRVSHAVFSPIIGKPGHITFMSKASYTEKMPAQLTNSQIRQHIEAGSPGATVKVASA